MRPCEPLVRGCNVSDSTPNPRTCEWEAIRLRPRSSFASPAVEMACYKRKYFFLASWSRAWRDVRTMLNGFLYVFALRKDEETLILV